MKPSAFHHLICLSLSFTGRPPIVVRGTSKFILSKSTCRWANCIRLICSGHTIPRFDTVLPVIKWWNHQGSALAAGVLHSEDIGSWQINSSSTSSLLSNLLSSCLLILNLFAGLHYVYRLKGRSVLTGLRFRSHDCVDTQIQGRRF